MTARCGPFGAFGGGSFFCLRDLGQRVGGLDERMFWAEDLDFWFPRLIRGVSRLFLIQCSDSSLWRRKREEEFQEDDFRATPKQNRILPVNITDEELRWR